MKRIRYILAMLCALYSVPSNAQVSINIGLPHVSIGINLPVYPELVVVPGYPVYYARDLDANFFFYDGVYWVYQDDNWYESSWYNGPWVLVEPEFVPVFILRIPVFYYRHPPAYFHGWLSDAPPRWGDHWGHDWERHRRGWDKWDRRIHHEPAPLPIYQRQYSGDRYPRQVGRQHDLHLKNYRYQPHDPAVRQLHQGPTEQARPVQPDNRSPKARGSIPQDTRRPVPYQQEPLEQGRPVQPDNRSPKARGSMTQDIQRPVPHQQDSTSPPHLSSSQRGGDQESVPVQPSPQQGRREYQIQRQQTQPEAAPREQQIQQYQGRERRQQNREFKQQNGDAERASPRRQGQENERSRDR